MAKDAPVNGMKKEIAELRAANEGLRDKVRELEETLDAIRSGEVDAIVVANGEGRQVFTLEGADHPYRALVENIREGALTISRDGMILYTNSRFAEMAKSSPDKIAGKSLLEFVCPEHRQQVELALKEILERPCRSRVRIHHGKSSLPVFISMNPLSPEKNTKISVVVTDRRKDEERLQLQARMLDAVGDAVIAADTHNRIIYWNDAATKIYGWEPEEAIGRDLIDVATPDISKKEARKISSQIAKGEIWTGEYVVKHRDGHEFPIHANDAPVFDDDGNLIAIIGASHDISEQKLVEQQLRYHANLVETVSDAIISTDTGLTIQSWNKAAENIYGWRPDEVLGEYGPDILRTEFPEGTSRKQLMKELFGEGAWQGEVIQQTKDGRKIFIEATSISLRNEAGEVIGGVSVGRDITERKHAEEALRESEEKFRNLVKYAPAAIYEMDLQGTKFLSVNEVMCNILGYTKEELLSKIPGDLLDPESRILFKERIRKKLAGEKISEPVEYRIRRKDGEWINTAISVGSFTYSDENPPRVVVIGHDITERKRMEEELRRKHDDLNAAYEEITSTQEELRQNLEELTNREKQLNEALAEKEVLLSEIHHRVKNNLAAFISLLSLEGSYEESPAGRDLKRDLQNRARTMALIHETLYRTRQYSDVDMNVYLNTLVNQVVSSYSTGQTIRIVVEAKEVTLDLVRATPIGLIVNELVTNTLKYAFPNETTSVKADRSEPGTIGIKMSSEDGIYLLKVSDNGVGLPAGLDVQKTQTLGLKLVNFLAKHQLRSKIEINTDKGTEFVFRFKKSPKMESITRNDTLVS